MKKTIFFLIGAFAILFFIALYYDKVHNPVVSPSLVQVPVSPAAVTRTQVLAIGIDTNTEASPSTVASGDSFLILIAGPSTPAKMNFEIIKTFKMLYAIDTNHTGEITANNPYFNSMALFHVKGDQKIIPFTQSDVHSIMLEPSMITKMKTGIPERVGDTVGQLFLTDGIKLPIKVIIVDKKDLRNALHS